MRPGFTLIELLVVISIIAVLASLLLPSISMVRGLAHTTGCASNLRQVAVGMMTYDQDNHSLPAAVDSPNHGVRKGGYAIRVLDLMQASPAIFACRADRRSTPERVQSVYSGLWYEGRRSYAMPCHTWGGGNETIRSLALSWTQTNVGSVTARIEGAQSLARIQDGSGTILVTERHDAFTGGVGNLTHAGIRTVTTEMSVPHRQRANAAFCDGHVQLITKVESVGTGSIGEIVWTAKGMWTTRGGD